MRYVIEFLIPIAIVVVVALMLFRRHSSTPAQTGSASAPNEATTTLSTGAFVLILIVGAVFTVALVWALHDGHA